MEFKTRKKGQKEEILESLNSEIDRIENQKAAIRERIKELTTELQNINQGIQVIKLNGFDLNELERYAESEDAELIRNILKILKKAEKAEYTHDEKYCEVALKYVAAIEGEVKDLDDRVEEINNSIEQKRNELDELIEKGDEERRQIRNEIDAMFEPLRHSVYGLYGSAVRGTNVLNNVKRKIRDK